MRAWVVNTLFIVMAGPVAAGDLPLCSADELVGKSPDYDEVNAHRQFKLPTVDYLFGTFG